MEQRNVLDTIDTRALGKELYEARRKEGLTQEDAANIIGVARTTMTAIEKGERRVKAAELIKLARAYRRQVSDFVRPRPYIEPFQPQQIQFRGPHAPSDEDMERVRPALDMLRELARNYLELEGIVGSPLARRYPSAYEVAGLPVEQAAEGIALDERNRLGLGDGPVPLLRDMLEQDVGLRIFYLSLPQKYSAIYVYDEQAGGCIAINSAHPEEQRRWSLAHEYCHFLANRHRPTISMWGGYQRRPESERLADSFAFCFLMPPGGLTRRFNDIRRATGKVTPADLCTLAHYYSASFEALARRLEMLRLLPTGTWDNLREGGFKVREAQRELGLAPIPARESMLPVRYQFLALDAFDRGLIGEGRLAHFLDVDLLEARRIAEVLRGQMDGVTDESVGSQDVGGQNLTKTVGV